MVTNGNLLEQEDIAEFARAGLDEFILSMHGVTKQTYEDLMDKGDYEKFHKVQKYITEEKKQHPKLRLRINYTFNEDNFHQLKDFFNLFGDYAIDIIQLRPIDKLGETTYANFSLKAIEPEYAAISGYVKSESSTRGITFLFPKTVSREVNESYVVKTDVNSSYLLPYTYCYVSPKYYWKDDFNWTEESFAHSRKRNNWNAVLFKNIFISKKELKKRNRNMLNYTIDLN